MRIRCLSPLLLCLLQLLSTTLAEPDVSNESTLVQREASSANALPPVSELLTSPKASPKGTLDAPVDGKDGKPHAGPWVETSADRDRKKAKESDNKEELAKLDEKTPSIEHIGPDGKPIPHSNDGVMDDPHRLGPKEGTRGTEGGVSERQKDSKFAAEKVPDGPKEAPPLPHSEQAKIPKADDDSNSKDAKSLDSGEKVLEVRTGTVAQCSSCL